MRYGIGLTGRHCASCRLLRSTIKVERSDAMGETVIVYTCRMRKVCEFLDRVEVRMVPSAIARQRPRRT